MASPKITAADNAFQLNVIRALAEAARNRAQPRIPSKTLQKAINVFVVNQGLAYVQIPHYWAVYVHDGRAGFSASRTTFLVWFRNPRDDPRLRNGVTPVRASDLRQLTEGEFKLWMSRNRIARARGLPQPMIIRTKVGPVSASLFFDNRVGMSGFKRQAEEIGDEFFGFHIRNRLGDLMKEVTESVTISL